MSASPESARRILVLGAGKMAEIAVRSLIDRGVESLTVVNRSSDQAKKLAERFRVRGVGLEALLDELATADVVVASTGSADVLLKAEQVEETMRLRRGQPAFFIDIGVPRNLDPAINDLADCYLYDIDDLDSVAAESMAGYREESVKAESIVAEETAGLVQTSRALQTYLASRYRFELNQLAVRVVPVASVPVTSIDVASLEADSPAPSTPQIFWQV